MGCLCLRDLVGGLTAPRDFATFRPMKTNCSDLFAAIKFMAGLAAGQFCTLNAWSLDEGSLTYVPFGNWRGMWTFDFYAVTGLRRSASVNVCRTGDVLTFVVPGVTPPVLDLAPYLADANEKAVASLAQWPEMHQAFGARHGIQLPAHLLALPFNRKTAGPATPSVAPASSSRPLSAAGAPDASPATLSTQMVNR